MHNNYAKYAELSLKMQENKKILQNFKKGIDKIK